MADLDDFFAKRDKKKSKKKFDTLEDTAKVLEQKAKEKKNLETGKSNYVQEGGRQSPGPGLPIGDDDEWIEAEDKQPDFSNLKIQELVLTSDDEDDPSQNVKDDEGSAEGPWNKVTKSKGKDKDERSKEEETTTTVEAEESTEKSEEKPEVADDAGSNKDTTETENKESEPKKYVPPSMRKKAEESSTPSAPKPLTSGGGSGGSAYVPPSKRNTLAAGPAALAPMKKKGAAPTLEDEESFPTLS